MSCVLGGARKCMVVLALLSTWSICARAQNTCSNQNMVGAFGFVVSGTNVQFNIQFAIIGRFVADGQGGFTGTATESTGGHIAPQIPFKGKYTVRPDCSGFATFAFPGDQNANLEFVLVDDGQELMILDADAGTVEHGTAKKQFPRPGQDKSKGANAGLGKENKQ
jgi:hypothetical protein